MKPNPISEGLPEAEHRDHLHRCWWGHAIAWDHDTCEPYGPAWDLTQHPSKLHTHWLPATALPLCNPNEAPDTGDDLDLDDLSLHEPHPSLSAAERNPSLCRR